MGLRRTRSLALVAAVPLLLAMAPEAPQLGTPAVPGGPTGISEIGAPSLPNGSVGLRLEPGSSVRLTPDTDIREEVLRLLDPADPFSLLEVTREVAADRWGGEATVSPGVQPTVGVAPAAVRAWHGDFDGDGLEDVLVEMHEEGASGSRLEARRGLDGSLLWSYEGADLGFPVGDLDGDGIDDLYTVAMEVHDSHVEDTCDAEGCSYESRMRYEWHATAWSGAGARELWSASFPGEWRVTSEYEEGTWGWHDRYELEVDELWSVPWPSTDHDGDGGEDLLLNHVDLEAVYVEDREDFVVGQRTGEAWVRGATTARVLRGSDGTELLRVTAEAAGVPLLEEVGDVVGDATPDLLWVSGETSEDTWSCLDLALTEQCDDPQEPTTYRTTVEALDGATLRSAWELSLEDTAWVHAVPVRDDLDGDGQGDVLLDAMSFAGGSQHHLVSDGAVRWTRDGYLALSAVVQLDGGPGQDLVFSAGYLGYLCDYLTEECEAEAELVVHRVDGATGALLADTSRSWSMEAGNGGWFTFSGGFDLDGDGHADPSLSVGTATFDDAWNAEYHTSVGAVQAAAHPTMLLEEVRDDSFFAISALPDLTGDGGGDLAEVTGDWPDETWTAFAFPARERLWSLGREDVWRMDFGDHDGIAGFEVARVLERDGRLLVESQRGADLSTRWSVPLD